jgi:NADPH2:quinone reductase
MAMTNAIVVHETGGPEVMRWEKTELPALGNGEARIRHTSIGFNMIDTYRRKGLYPCDLPFIPGSEAAGVVEEVDDAVDFIKVGDRVVYAISDIGAYCEQRIINAQHLIKIPETISDDFAAAAFLKGLTAWYLIHKTWQLKSGDSILVYAAAGGVGTILCQWAKKMSAHIIGVVGSEDKINVAKDNGCDAVINYSRDDIAETVKELTNGQGVDVAYDSMGLDTFNASLDCLRPRGLMVTYGNATGAVPPVDILHLMRKGSLFLTRPTLLHYATTRDELAEGSIALFDVIDSGDVKIKINQTYDLKDAAKAHAGVESRKTTGATILKTS